MKNFKKVLGSVFTIGIVLAVGIMAVNAYFSDTETSTGNVFAAGAIDLKIDNDSYYNWLYCNPTSSEWEISGNHPAIASFDNYMLGLIGTECSTSWEAKDLEGELFFNFADLKPGDWGEDTISLVVHDNDAWACMDMSITGYDELGGANLALAQNIQFVWWADDGNNVLEQDEYDSLRFTEGPAHEVLNASYALADSQTNVWNPLSAGIPLPGTPFDSEDPNTYYIAKAWCFGELGFEPQDPNHRATNNPQSHPGITCDGEPVGNAAQGGQFMVDVNFSSIQARNNAGYVCPSSTSGPTVGAALGAFTPLDLDDNDMCDVTVGSEQTYATIQAGIDAAVNGETVCVANGNYTEDVNINKSITLSGNGASATSTINGVGTDEAGALVITANNVVVEGFNVIGTGVSAIRISGARDNVTVRYNKAVAASGKSAFLTDGGQSNHTITHNMFEGSASQLVYVNGTASVALASTNVDFTYNTFGGTATGPLLGTEATGSVVTNNVFSGTTSFTSLESWVSDLLVNVNNFNVVGQMHVTNSVAGTLNAQNNWWGDNDPSDNVSGDVNYIPWVSSAYPQN